MKWTKAFRKSAGKEMTVVSDQQTRADSHIWRLSLTTVYSLSQDSTFEFEKRRNRPVKYNRETMETTLRAIKRVSEIQTKRQDMFYKMRMRAHKATQREVIRAEIKKGIEILAPAAADKEKAIAIATQKIAQRHRAQEGKMQN